MPLINRVGGGSAELQSKTVKSTTNTQTVKPDTGYDGISSITVNPIKLQTKSVTPTTSSQSVTPSSSYDGLSKVTVNAIPSSYVQPSTTKGATTYTPSTSAQTIISAGTYCSGAQTIKGDSNLLAENILSGKSIFGVNGTALKFARGLSYSTSGYNMLSLTVSDWEDGDVVHFACAFKNATAGSTDSVFAIFYEGGLVNLSGDPTGYSMRYIAGADKYTQTISNNDYCWCDKTSSVANAQNISIGVMWDYVDSSLDYSIDSQWTMCIAYGKPSAKITD